MFSGNNVAPINSFYTATDFLTYSNLLVLIIGIVCSYPIFGKSQSIHYEKVESIFILILFVVTYVFAMTSTFSVKPPKIEPTESSYSEIQKRK